MQRQIFKVDAFIVDANGTFNVLSGYPKLFDSKNYSNDIDKAKGRAEGEFSDTWGSMCKVDTRQVQTCVLSNVSGHVIELKTMGELTPLPDPEPEPEPEPEVEEN